MAITKLFKVDIMICFTKKIDSNDTSHEVNYILIYLVTKKVNVWLDAEIPFLT